MSRIFWFILLAIVISGMEARYDGPKDTATIDSIDEPVLENRQEQYIRRIVATYKVEQPLAEEVVSLAFKYGNANRFPTPVDLLAIIGIESRFRPTAKSGLRKDKAEGLTQIRPKVWRHLIPAGALTSIENQVKYGSIILSHYYDILGNEKDAANAYNVGLTNHYRGQWNPRYESRFAEAKRIFM